MDADKIKIGIFKVFGLVTMLSGELTAAAEDGKITIAEGVRIIRKVCEALGIKLDETGFDIK